MPIISTKRLSNVLGYEQVIRLQGQHCRGFISIHSTRRGPAFGGVRYIAYSSERDALDDALRLSHAMSLKCAMADLPSGGAKSVLIRNPSTDKQEALKEFAEVLRSLEGTYFAGPDLGMEAADLELLSALVPNVASETDGGLGSIAEHTALGVWHAIQACFERTQREGPSVAIQGMGSVGSALAQFANRENTQLKIADIEPQKCEVAAGIAAEVMDPHQILTTSCSVLAPCAMGGVITKQIAEITQARAICGSANNMLDEDETSSILNNRGVLFVPDFVSNAGGVIRGVEYYLLKRTSSAESITNIRDRTLSILDEARKLGCTPLTVATSIAQQKLNS